MGLLLFEGDCLVTIEALTGLPSAEADRLCRWLANPELAEVATSRFLTACERAGIARPIAEPVAAELRRFARYAFCRAHAVNYGLIPWQAVQLRARWRTELLGFHCGPHLMTLARRVLPAELVDSRDCAVWPGVPCGSRGWRPLKRTPNVAIRSGSFCSKTSGDSRGAAVGQQGKDRSGRSRPRRPSRGASGNALWHPGDSGGNH